MKSRHLTVDFVLFLFISLNGANKPIAHHKRPNISQNTVYIYQIGTVFECPNPA